MPKLVRDLIPIIMEKNNKKGNFHTANEAEYADSLLAKLTEETEEYRQNPCLEELCDILEVVYALTEHKGYTKSDLEEARVHKLNERGGFKNRIIMS
jgi:predicted house-cleaning noncanonical NTP pyrophosphatase (MazG superfamily)